MARTTVCVCVVYIFITIMKTNKQTELITKKQGGKIYINKIRENLVIINLKMHGIKVLTIIYNSESFLFLLLLTKKSKII